MLVLSRKPSERIRIGDNIFVTIVRIGPNNVRVGIDAPRDINIVRAEIARPQQKEDTDERCQVATEVVTG